MSSLFVEGQQPMPNEQMAFDSNVVGPHYHETMGIKIVEGRGFTEQDREGSVPVIIINEALAQRLSRVKRALGRKVTRKTNGPGLEIIGITRDIKHHELTETPLPHFDLPALQRGYDFYTNVVLRISRPAASLTTTVRTKCWDQSFVRPAGHLSDPTPPRTRLLPHAWLRLSLQCLVSSHFFWRVSDFTA